MVTQGPKQVGRFNVEFEIANNQGVTMASKGKLESDRVRRKKIVGVVDSGAARLVLPAAVAKELSFPVKKEKVRVPYGDRRSGLRPEVEEVHLYLQGRDGVFKAVVEPKRDTALIGAIVLEDLDFLVDCTRSRLVPRDPDHIVSEIE